MDKFPLAPLNSSELQRWIIQGDLDTLSIQGWLVQGAYRVAVSDQRLDDFISGMKAIERAGYKFDSTDFYWISLVATFVEYFHRQPNEALELLNSVEAPDDLSTFDWSDLLFAGAPEVVGWFSRQGVLQPMLSSLGIRWIDLNEVIAAIASGTINLNDQRWNWLGTRVNEPGIDYNWCLLELFSVGVQIYDFYPLIGSCSIYVLSSILDTYVEQRSEFWKQWSETLNAGTGSSICYNTYSMIVGYSLAAYAQQFQDIIGDYFRYLPPHLEQLINASYTPFTYEPVEYQFERLYNALSVDSIAEFDWKYMLRWREVIRQMYDLETVEQFIIIGAKCLKGDVVAVGRTPLFNYTIMNMLRNKLNDLSGYPMAIPKLL